MALNKEQIAQRIARELKDGYYVNLGIGIPTLVANYIPEGVNVVLQSENGLLGMGPFPFEGEEDPDLKAVEDHYFVYPTKLREYQARYRNSFLHGGISPEEMIVPVVSLTPRR